MFAICECGYDSGDYDNIYALKEKISLDGGDYVRCVCPLCKKDSLVN